jgi:two-component system sensor histidine kinase TctE
MSPLLAIFAVAAAVAFYGTQALTEGVFDRWLLDAAQSLAQQVKIVGDQASVDLPPAAAAVLAYDAVDKTWYAVLWRGKLLTGDGALPIHGERETSYRSGRAFDAWFAGEAVRVAAVEVPGAAGESATVLAGETTIKRQRAEKRAALMLLPMGLLLAFSAGAISVAVRTAIRPLERIASRWNERTHESLQPIESDDLPAELMPFATALNGLMSRMSDLLARERQFAATAAHQLRTPLAGLQLGLARAAAAPDLAGARQVLRELEQSTQRTGRLAQQLLMFGRLDPESSGGVVRTRVDLVEFTREVGAAFAGDFLDKGINLELRDPGHSIAVDLQEDLMAEAIGNLLDNALRYTRGGGYVVVEFGRDPPSLCICDSGSGVPEEEQQSIFERFVRGTGAVGNGSGLGLAIVRDIAALHGARVRAFSAAGGGLCVEIEMPEPPGSSGT